MKQRYEYIEAKPKKQRVSIGMAVNLLLIMSSICLTVVAVEIYFGYFKTKSTKTYKVYSKVVSGKPFMEEVDNFGALPMGAGRVRKVRVLGDEIVGDATETFENKFRSIPDRNLNKKQRNTIFYGGSYTYGLGVDDRQTLPYLYKEASGQENVYSISHNGWGVHQLLWMLRNHWLNKLVDHNQNGGTLVYGFIQDHLNRFFHKDISQIQIPFNHKTPSYKLVGADQFIHAGTFEQVSPVESQRQRLQAKTNLGRKIVFKTHKDFWTKNEQQVFCKYLIQVKQELKKRNYDFKVLYFPVTEVPTRLDKCIKSNLQVLDYREKKTFLERSGNLKLADYDSHPNFGHNWYLSHWLARDLGPKLEYASN